ncbi:hypothetical protein A9Q99_01855 [Gammaproteobacteria bacterium 45_16_T64]|nr:hypothetical protein A9Q99_01855 [Gammaproteobacteria bacterium 45_16_T64]
MKGGDVIRQQYERFNRIERVLQYINDNLAEPLSVEHIAEQSCWSRWQFQRVFISETGLSVAQYVRELRLSVAAEQLLTTQARQLDIALACGFESEVSFSRSFRQFFQCTPGTYRRRGERVNLRTPLTLVASKYHQPNVVGKLLQIRVETRPAFVLAGAEGTIDGILAEEPNFSDVVPRLWADLKQIIANNPPSSEVRIGAIAVAESDPTGLSLPYWAGFEVTDEETPTELALLQVPAQQYAVIPYKGPITELHKTVEWFIFHWLPESEYCGMDGYDLEIYGPGFSVMDENASMEYWVPVRSK